MSKYMLVGRRVNKEKLLLGMGSWKWLLALTALSWLRTGWEVQIIKAVEVSNEQEKTSSTA